MKPTDDAIKAALAVFNNMLAPDDMQRALTAASAVQFKPVEEYAGLIERLRDFSEICEGKNNDARAEAADAIEALCARIAPTELAAAIAERDKLREALKPFARLSDRIPDDYEDGRPDVTITLEKVPVKVIRAALAALDGTEPPPPAHSDKTWRAIHEVDLMAWNDAINTAADVAGGFPARIHGALHVDPVKAAQQVASEIEKAIRRLKMTV